MPNVGGDITEIRWTHPTLGNGVFLPKAGEDSEYDLGGFRINDDKNNVDGSGGMIIQKNRALWSFSVKCAWDANDRKDLESANALAQSNVLATYTFSSSNGTVYRGQGMPVGDMVGNGNTSTFDFKVNGSGILKQVV